MQTSLRSRKNHLAIGKNQIDQLNSSGSNPTARTQFSAKLAEIDLLPLRPTNLEIFQVNMGKMCNQVCRHCHVDAGPDRREIMTRATMEKILTVLQISTAHTVDLTGGAPEMNPEFRWFVSQLTRLNKKVIVRCNLTIILANPKYHDLPQFYREHNVHIVSSLPHFDQGKTDRQRGDGVFKLSIRALNMLNEVGYGQADSGLLLDLVYNPAGAFLPSDQAALEREFKLELRQKFGIEFNQLFAITNMPISRFLEYLIESGNYDAYMEKIINAFNPVAAKGVMCRNTISVGWDGQLFDCDFNQMLDLPVASPASRNLDNYSEAELAGRSIVVNQHCFGCTAGSGSSCGGTTA